MAQVLDAPLPRHQTFRLGVHPQLWKCGNLECKNLVSDVSRKSKFKKYCSTDCRNYVNQKNRRERDKKKSIARVLEPRACNACGKSFIPKKKRTTKYCSMLCSVRVRRGNKINIECRNCGIELKSMRNRQFCSLKCRLVNFHKNKLEVIQ